MGSPWRPWEVLCWKLLRVYHWMGYGEHNLKQREESKFILVVVVVAIDRGVQYVFYYIYTYNIPVGIVVDTFHFTQSSSILYSHYSCL